MKSVRRWLALNREYANSVDSAVPAFLQTDLHGEMRLVADRAHRVPAPGQVIGQEHIAWPKSIHGAIAYANFRLARQGDDVLPARRCMPVIEITCPHRLKFYLYRRLS